MTILERADKITSEDRQKAYGHPSDNHLITSLMWTAFLRDKLRDGEALNSRDVCMLNILQKVSREAHDEKEDNLVDIAGFARNAEQLQEPRVHDD